MNLCLFPKWLSMESGVWVNRASFYYLGVLALYKFQHYSTTCSISWPSVTYVACGQNGPRPHIQAEELFQRLFRYCFTGAVAMGYLILDTHFGFDSDFMCCLLCSFRDAADSVRRPLVFEVEDFGPFRR